MPATTPTPQAYAGGPRDALEVLARLAGRSAFVTPAAGSGGAPALTTDDIAHALGRTNDALGEYLALAIATQSLREWPAIQRLAFPRLLAGLEADPRDAALVEGSRRHRLRIVMHDVLRDLVWPHRRNARKATGMRRADYSRLYRYAGAAFESWAYTCAGAALNDLRTLR
ncbi:MAG TPA: hypothetical protein VFG73_02355 [Rhodanobacteraceae bacterium]|nr:hypothetical protein [Rhodanobacteraceae bacterium]